MLRRWCVIVGCLVELALIGCQQSTTLEESFTEPTSNPATIDRSGEDVTFYFRPIGPEFFFRPTITHVQVVDLDADGLQEVLACDAQQNGVFRYDYSEGEWRETRLADNPAWLSEEIGVERANRAFVRSAQLSQAAGFWIRPSFTPSRSSQRAFTSASRNATWPGVSFSTSPRCARPCTAPMRTTRRAGSRCGRRSATRRIRRSRSVPSRGAPS